MFKSKQVSTELETFKACVLNNFKTFNQKFNFNKCGEWLMKDEADDNDYCVICHESFHEVHFYRQLANNDNRKSKKKSKKGKNGV